MTVGEYFKKAGLPVEMRTRSQAERYIEGTYNPRSSDVAETMNAVLYLIDEFDQELMCIGIKCSRCPYYNGSISVDGCRNNRMQHIKELYIRRHRCSIDTML